MTTRRRWGWGWGRGRGRAIAAAIWGRAVTRGWRGWAITTVAATVAAATVTAATVAAAAAIRRSLHQMSMTTRRRWGWGRAIAAATIRGWAVTRGWRGWAITAATVTAATIATAAIRRSLHQMSWFWLVQCVSFIFLGIHSSIILLLNCPTNSIKLICFSNSSNKSEYDDWLDVHGSW